MNTVYRATGGCTDNERLFMRCRPYIVEGRCDTCHTSVSVRVYGLKSELQQATLVCAECSKR